MNINRVDPRTRAISSAMDFRWNGLFLFVIFLLVQVHRSQGFSSGNVFDVPDIFGASSAKIPNKKNDEMCQKQLVLLIEAYQAKELWSLKVFDAWGKSQSGLFSGNLVNFGHWEQCLAMRHEFEDPADGIFEGQHCMIFFRDSPSVNKTDIQTNMLLPQTMMQIELLRQYINVFNVKLGTALCLPLVCSPEMVRKTADKMLALNNLKTTEDYDQESFCNTINILQMRKSDMFAA